MAGGQVDGRDNELGFAPMMFADKPGVLEVARRQARRRFAGRRGLKRQYSKSSAAAGKIAEIAKDNMKGGRGGGLAEPFLPPVGNVGATREQLG